MRFYKRTGDDKLNAGRRSLAEAERGLVFLALERLRDLAEEFPNDPEVLYVEALVRQDHLGQGITARELFDRVYHLIPPNDPRLAETLAFAACNAAGLARDEAEVLRWLDLALNAGPNDRALAQFANGMRTNLGQGVAYRDILWNNAAESQAHGVHGKMACLIELLLNIRQPMELTKEVEARRRRAEALRELDRKGMTQRDASRNIPMPDERMALQEGLRELEQALELDPYDAELWNFRSAWCILLKRYEEAIPHAERALILRPQGYVKPLINIATALGYLGRHDESAAVAQKAINRATDAADRSLARTVLADFRQPPAPLAPPAVRGLSQAAWDEARNIANNELGAQGGDASELAAGIMKRVRGAGADAGMLAELLNDFFPETVFVAISEADRTRPGFRWMFADAASHLVTHANEVVRSDAARFLALAILTAGNAAAIRSEYRRIFPETANLTTGATEAIDPAMHRALQSYHSRLPDFFTSWEPIEDEGPLEAERPEESAVAMNAPSHLLAAFVMLGAGTGGLWVMYHLLFAQNNRWELLLFLIITFGYVLRYRRYTMVVTGNNPFLVGRQLAFLVFPCFANLTLIALWYSYSSWSTAVLIALPVGWIFARGLQLTIFAHEFTFRDRP